MKRLILFLALAFCPTLAVAGGTFIVTATGYVVVSGNCADTLGRTRLTPDSMRIVVTDSAGTELHDAWYEDADAQAVLNGDVLTFTDQWQDINGAATTGTFSMMVTIASDAQGNVDVFDNYSYTIISPDVALEDTYNNVKSTIDSIQAWDAAGGVTSDIQAVIDTLNNHDNWVAQEAGRVKSVLDTIQAWDAAGGVTNDVQAILDTLNNHDSWVAQQATLTGTLTANVTQISGDGTAADNFETMLDGTGGKQLALGQLRVVADGTNYDSAIVAIGAENGFGIIGIGAGSGEGIRGHGGATGSGIEGVGGGTSGNGINAMATLNGYGFAATGSNGAAGILAQGAGTNCDGFKATATGTGVALFADAAGTGAGMRVEAASGNGLELYTATGTAGLYSLSDAGDGARFDANGAGPNYGMRIMGADDGAGMRIEAGTVGRGLWVLGSGAYEGARISAGATGNGVAIVGGASSGDGMIVTSTSGDAAELTSAAGGSDLNATLNLNDITGDFASTAFESGVYQSYWNQAFNTAWTAGSMGDSLNNASYVQGSAGVWNSTQRDSVLSGVRDDLSDKKITPTDTTITGKQVYAEMTAWDLWTYRIDTMTVEATGEDAAEALNGLIDTAQAQDGWIAQQAEVANLNGGTLLSAVDVWNVAFGTAFTAGSMGDSLNNSSYVQGAASGLTATQVADTVWKSLMSARSGVAGSFGDSAQDWGRSGASGTTPWDIWTFRIDTMQVEATGEDAAEALNGLLDTAQSQDGWVAQQTGQVWNTTQRDSALSASRDDLSDKKITPTDTTTGGIDVGGDATPWDFWTFRIDTMSVEATGEDAAEAINGILDTLQSHDGWVAQQTEVTNLNGGTLLAAADVWNIAFNTAWTAGSMGDSLNNSSYVQGSASGLTATQVADSVWKSLVSARSGVVGSFGDSSLDWGRSGASGSTPWDIWTFRIDTMLAEGTGEDAAEALNGLLDTVQSHDGWVAQEAGRVKSVLDSIQAWDGAGGVTHDVQSILDSLNSQDGWIAQQAEVTNLNGGTLLTVSDNIGVNLDDVSGTLSGAEIALTQSEFTPDYSTIDSTILSRIIGRKVWGLAAGTGSDSVLTSQRMVQDAKGNVIGSVGSVSSSVTVGDKTGFSLTVADKALIADTTYKQFTYSTNENQFKADVSALALQASVTGVLDSVGALLDSAYNYDAWIASRDSLNRAMSDTRLSVIRWGGVPSGYDSTLTRYFPLSGAANKDSAQVTAWAAGVPTLFYRERYHHSNVLTVADSLRGKPGTGGGW